MENKEDVLQALEEFSRKPSDKIPPILDEFLVRVALTGETVFPWSKVKAVFIQKMDQSMLQFNADIPVVDDSPVPNVENIHFDLHRKRVLKAINAFTAAPFTVQRLCELITNPRKHYCITDKYMRGLEKNVQVVSTVDPHGNKIVCESKTVYNGLDANGFENNGKHTEEGFNSPFLPPPPPSSAHASPIGSTAWPEGYANSPQSTWPAAAGDSYSNSDGKPGESSKSKLSKQGTLHEPCDEPSEFEPVAKKLKMDHEAEEAEAAAQAAGTSAGSEENQDSDSASSLETEENEAEVEKEAGDEVKPSDIVERSDSGGFETTAMSEDDTSQEQTSECSPKDDAVTSSECDSQGTAEDPAPACAGPDSDMKSECQSEADSSDVSSQSELQTDCDDKSEAQSGDNCDSQSKESDSSVDAHMDTQHTASEQTEDAGKEKAESSPQSQSAGVKDEESALPESSTESCQQEPSEQCEEKVADSTPKSQEESQSEVSSSPSMEKTPSSENTKETSQSECQTPDRQTPDSSDTENSQESASSSSSHEEAMETD